jgi:hypothetical protein
MVNFGALFLAALLLVFLVAGLAFLMVVMTWAIKLEGWGRIYGIFITLVAMAFLIAMCVWLFTLLTPSL